MNKSVVPEEKLLRLIRQKNNSAHLNDVKSSQNNKKLKKKVRIKEKGAGVDLLEYINRSLIFFSIGILTYIFVKHFVLDYTDARPRGLKIKIEKKRVSETKPPFYKEKSFDYYQELFNERNVFEMPRQQSGMDKIIDIKSTVDLSKKLKVIGILLDKNPRAVVENLKEKQTYFISVGERIEDALVKEIHANKVVFIYDDKTVELSP